MQEITKDQIDWINKVNKHLIDSEDRRITKECNQRFVEEVKSYYSSFLKEQKQETK